MEIFPVATFPQVGKNLLFEALRDEAANGTMSFEQLAAGTGRQWKTVRKEGGVHFIEKLPGVKSASMPMHTHAKTKVYASIEKGKLKEITVMNPKTGARAMDIHHLHKHGGFQEHAHYWKGGKRVGDAPLTQGQKNFLDKLKKSAENITDNDHRKTAEH